MSTEPIETGSKQTLRGVIEYRGGEVPHDALVSNLKLLTRTVTSGALTWERPDDLRIYQEVARHFGTYGEVASPEIILERCDGDLEVEERLKDIAAVPPLMRTNYLYLVERAVARQREIRFEAILRAGQAIRTKGVEVGEGRDKRMLKGLADAQRYVREQLDAYEVTEQAGLVSMSAADIMKPLDPPTWSCEGLRLSPQVGTIMLAGYGDSAKTMLAQNMALSFASGMAVFGVHPVRQGRVLHIDYEQGEYLTRERYQRLARAMGIDLDALVREDRLRLACFPAAKLDDPATEALLKAAVTGFDVVIIDSLRAASPKTEENSSEARIPLDMLSRVCAGTTLPLVIHHARKPTRDQAGSARMSIRGSSALYDALGGCFVAERMDDGTVTLMHEKERLRGLKLDPISYRIVDVPKGDDPRWGLRVELVPNRAEDVSRTNLALYEQVLSIIAGHPGVTTRELRTRPSTAPCFTSWTRATSRSPRASAGRRSTRR